jgi:hypothetical protein
MEKDESPLEKFNNDLKEVEEVISSLKRENVKQYLSEYKKTLENNIAEENKRIEQLKIEQAKKEIQSNQTQSNKEKEAKYETITKYAFDGTGAKFVK